MDANLLSAMQRMDDFLAGQLGQTMTYQPKSGDAIECTGIFSDQRTEEQIEDGRHEIRRGQVDLRKQEVPAPQIGATLTIDGAEYVIDEIPFTDENVTTVSVRSATAVALHHDQYYKRP
ncbi:MAG: hypothetical protein JXA82_18120 [Sedimentisphaerales bacterium]|nr:hypothetical protein [Sedimentisphaerales bacterium]